MKVLNSKSVEVAMPRLIPQSELKMKFVMDRRVEAEKALKQVTGRRLSERLLKDTLLTLFHWKKNANEGIWFISRDRVHVDFLYAYSSVSIQGVTRACEALAYNFTKNNEAHDRVTYVIKGIFFDHLLKDKRFVVTDSLYTPEGLDWFVGEYNTAFARKYNVYAIDMNTESCALIDKEEFDRLQPLYWGKTALHQEYRFAIELV